MDIDIGREVTVRRWRVEHAQYGGEDVLMNTVDFALEYKNTRPIRHGATAAKSSRSSSNPATAFCLRQAPAGRASTFPVTWCLC